jgi:ABC-type transporter Mla subunit MlaD
MNKKGNIAGVLLVGLAALVVLAIVYAAFTGPFEVIRDTFNDSFTEPRQLEVSQHIDNTWHYVFLVLGLSVIVWMILSAISRQSREDYR